MEITKEQKAKLHRAASIGLDIVDACTRSGVPLVDMAEAVRDKGIQQIYAEGRSEGVSLIREQLTLAAAKGNVSAMRALKTAELPVGDIFEEVQQHRVSAAEEHATWRKVNASVNSLFARQKALIELGEAEDATSKAKDRATALEELARKQREFDAAEKTYTEARK